VRNDIKGSKKLCTVAYWHNPRFSSGWHGSDASFKSVWQILYDGGVDLILNGHDHDYERFAPRRARLSGFPERMTEYVVGTGGGELARVQRPTCPEQRRPHPGSLRSPDPHARKTGVSLRFLDVFGRSWMSGWEVPLERQDATLVEGPPAAVLVGPNRSSRPRRAVLHASWYHHM